MLPDCRGYFKSVELDWVTRIQMKKHLRTVSSDISVYLSATRTGNIRGVYTRVANIDTENVPALQISFSLISHLSFIFCSLSYPRLHYFFLYIFANQVYLIASQQY